MSPIDFKSEEKRFWEEIVNQERNETVLVDFVMFDKIARHFRNIGEQEYKQKEL